MLLVAYPPRRLVASFTTTFNSIYLLFPTSKALVTTSKALVPSSFLLLLVRHLLLEAMHLLLEAILGPVGPAPVGPTCGGQETAEESCCQTAAREGLTGPKCPVFYFFPKDKETVQEQKKRL